LQRKLKERIDIKSKSDDIRKYYNDYIHTENLKEIWNIDESFIESYIVNKKS